MPEAVTEPTGLSQLPESMRYGLDAPSVDPPLPTDAAPDASAVPQESQQDVETKTVEEGKATELKTEAEPAPEAGAPEVKEPDKPTEVTSAEEEAARAATAGKAASFWGNFKDPNKPAEEVRQHLQEQSASRYAELETATVAKVIEEPSRLERIFKANPDIYKGLADLAAASDPDYFIQKITGKEGVTAEQVVAALNGGDTSALAKIVTDEKLEELRNADFDELADELQTARDTAKEEKPGAEPSEGKPQTEQGKPADPVEIVERYQTNEREVNEAFEASIAPVVTFATKKVDDAFGPPPTPREYELAPDVAYLKAARRALFVHGDGGELSSFRDGLGKWGEHRKLKDRDFDEVINRVGRFSESREKENGAEAASELLPFADAYFNERSNLPLFLAMGRLIELAAQGTNPPVPKETIITGSVSQPSSSTPQNGAQWLIANAVERASG